MKEFTELFTDLLPMMILFYLGGVVLLLLNPKTIHYGLRVNLIGFGIWTVVFVLVWCLCTFILARLISY